MKTHLVLSPHVDDAVLFCGGTIARAISDKDVVHVASFSFSTESIPDMFPRLATRTEFFDSCNKLNINIDNRYTYKYHTRYFHNHRQDILTDMIQLRDTITPDVVYIPCSKDVHQDHQVIHNEGVRCFKNSCSILGFIALHNILNNVPHDMYVKLDREHLDTKLAAWNCFESQHGKRSFDTIESQSRVHGSNIGSDYAEIFEVIRLIK